MAPHFKAIALGGILGGLCDISYVLLFYGMRDVPSARILQSIASGLLGKSAYAGGAASALLGGLLHFFIALCASAVFYLICRRLAWTVRHPLLSGVAFGLGIYLVMNFIVVPLSAIGHRITPVFPFVLGDLFVHMFLVGIPIALCIARACTAPYPQPIAD